MLYWLVMQDLIDTYRDYRVWGHTVYTIGENVGSVKRQLIRSKPFGTKSYAPCRKLTPQRGE